MSSNKKVILGSLLLFACFALIVLIGGIFAVMFSAKTNISAESSNYHDTHFVNGHTENGTAITNSNFDNENQTFAISSGGDYYLSENVVGKITVEVGDNNEVHLCLNGYSIEAPDGDCPIITVSGGTLNLYDHDNRGVITGANRDNVQGGGIKVSNGSTLNMYGGTISNNESQQGGGVYIDSGTFNMFAGIITNNVATQGGGIKVSNGGTLNMYGGTISNNESQQGGGVYIDSGTFNMFAGIITNNVTTQNGGAGVYVNGNSRFVMSGGRITDNTATSVNGGGVFVTQGATFEISGCPIITGNHAKGGAEENNVTIEYSSVTIIGELDYGAKIGLTPTYSAEDGANKNPPVIIISGWKNGDIQPYNFFTIDDNDYTKNSGWAGKNLWYEDGKIVGYTASEKEAELQIPVATVTVDGTTTNYSTINAAWTAAYNANATVKLYDDLTIETELESITGTVTLDLNGHALDLNKLKYIEVGTNASFTITDSGAGGTLKGGPVNSNIARLVYVNGGKFVLNDGMLSGDSAALVDQRAGAVVNVDSGEFEMTGGVITGNEIQGDYGGGVSIGSAGKFTMSGGEISGNKDANGGKGGGVYVKGQFSLIGGLISSNNGTNGGGVYVDGGTFAMNGGVISKNNGGGVYVLAGKFELTGGSITNSEFYGGVYVCANAEFTMTGGSITGNITSGGVNIENGGTFNLSGTAVITDNKNSQKTQNVKITKGSYINITGELKSGSNIGITMLDGKDGSSASGAFTVGYADHNNVAPDTFFTSDNDAFGISYGYSDAKFEAAIGNSVVRIETDGGNRDLADIIEGWNYAIDNSNATVILLADVTVSAQLEMTDENITLDLNGHTLDLGYFYNLLINGGTLALTSSADGGKLTNVTIGSAVKVNGGTFELNGGAITGNGGNNNIYGGGVYVNGGTFVMSGGEISGNTATMGGGVYIESGTFTMTGGIITNNAVPKFPFDDKDPLGGGVYVNGGTVNISGNAQITGNIKKSYHTDYTTYDEDAGNVYLSADVVLNVSGALTGATVGIMLDSDVGTFTSGYGANNPSVAPSAFFTSDNSEYKVVFAYVDGNTEAAIGAEAVEVTVGSDSAVNFGTIDEAWAYALGKTATVKLLGDVTANGELSAIASGDLTLDLNGNTLDLNGSASRNSNIQINNGGTFTLNDTVGGGKITGGYASNGGGVAVNGGTFNVNGGAVSGNTATGNGGGVYVSENGTLNINGSVTVNNNTTGNVYLANGNLIQVNGDITGSNIYVTLGSGTGIFTDGFGKNNISSAPSSCFSSDVQSHNVIYGYTNGYFEAALGIRAVEVTTGGKTYPFISIDEAWAYALGKTATVKLLGDVTANGELSAIASGDLTLDLNGNTLDLNGSASRNSNIQINNGGTFTLNDTVGGGKITGGYASNGGGVYVNGGTFTMTGGAVSGNTATGNGGGVYVNGGTFTMTGGAVNDNTVTGNGGGVAVNGGMFTMNGGTVSGNSAGSYGGILVYSGGMFTMIGGTVSGNNGDVTSGIGVAGVFNLGDSANGFSGIIDHLYISSGKIINIYGKLNNSTKISVKLAGTTGQFTNGFGGANADKDPADYFVASAGSAYVIRKVANEVRIDKAITVTFYDDDETTVLGVVNTYAAEIVNAIQDPVREQTVGTVYTFDGWYTSRYQVRIDFPRSFTDNTQVYALYAISERKYDVTVISGSNGNVNNAGTNSFGYLTSISVSGNILTIGSQSFTANGDYGYILSGFRLQGGGELGDGVTGDMTIVAEFKADYWVLIGFENISYTATDGSPSTAGDTAVKFTFDLVLQHAETGERKSVENVSVTVDSENYLRAGNNTVTLSYKYTDVNYNLKTSEYEEDVNVTALKKTVNVLWYYDGATESSTSASRSYTGSSDLTKLVAVYTALNGDTVKVNAADAAIQYTKDGAATDTTRNAGEYKFSLKDNADYDFQNNEFTFTILKVQINLADDNTYKWTLDSYGSDLRSGYVYVYTVGVVKEYYATEQSGKGTAEIIDVTRSYARYRDTELTIVLNNGDIADLPNGGGKRSSIEYENNTHKDVGYYTGTTAKLKLLDTENYIYVSNGLDSGRLMTIVISDNGTTAVITKSWYILKIDNGLKSQSDGTYGEEYRIDSWTFGADVTVSAPRLEHGDEGVVGGTVTFDENDKKVKFELLYWTDDNSSVQLGDTFYRYNFNDYINKTMPAGRYVLKVTVNDITVDTDHEHWWETGATDTSDGGTFFAGFTREFGFTVYKAVMNVTDTIKDKYIYTYDGTLKMYGSDELSATLIYEQGDRIGIWKTDAYNAYYGYTAEFHLERWQNNEYITLDELNDRNDNIKPVNVGTYYVYYRIVAPNYTTYGGDGSKMFTVDINNKTITTADLDGIEYTIDGKVNNALKTASGASVDYDVAGYTVGVNKNSVPTGVTVSIVGQTLFTNANTYTITVTYTFGDNYDGAAAGTTLKLVINKAVVDPDGWYLTDNKGATISDGYDGYVYDGTVHSFTVHTPTGVEQVGALTGGGFADAGDHTIKVVLKPDDNHKFADGSETKTYIVTVTVREAEITALDLGKVEFNVADGHHFTYNGGQHTVTVKSDTLPDGVNTPQAADYDYGGRQLINADTYTIKLTLTADKNHKFADGVDGIVSISVVIDKATVDMTGFKFDDVSVPYDGDAHRITASNIPDGLTPNYEYDGDFTNVRNIDHTVTLTLTPDGNHKFVDNATSKEFKATVTITPIDYDITGWKFEDESGEYDYDDNADEYKIIYDGETHSLRVTGTPNGVKITYTIIDADKNVLSGNSVVNAGTYTVKATFEGDANHNALDEDFYLTATIIVDTQHIDVGDVEVKAETTVIFDKDGTEVFIDVSGLPENVDVEYSQTEFTAVGEYTVTVTLRPVNNNYILDGTTEFEVKLYVLTDTLTVYVDNDGNVVWVSVKCDSGFMLGTELKIELLENYTSDLISDDIKAAYDIKLINGDDTLQPSGKVTVRLLIPEALRNIDFIIVHVHGGSASDIEYTVDGNYVMFETDSFSAFAFVTEAEPEKEVAPPLPTDPTDTATPENPADGSNSAESGATDKSFMVRYWWLWLILLLLLLLIIIIIILVCRRKDKEGDDVVATEVMLGTESDKPVDAVLTDSEEQAAAEEEAPTVAEPETEEEERPEPNKNSGHAEELTLALAEQPEVDKQEEARKQAEEEAKRKARAEKAKATRAANAAKRKAEQEAAEAAAKAAAEEEARKQAEEEAKRKARAEKAKATRAANAAKRKAEQEAAATAEEAARKQAEEEAKRKARAEKAKATRAANAAKRKAEQEAAEAAAKAAAEEEARKQAEEEAKRKARAEKAKAARKAREAAKAAERERINAEEAHKILADEVATVLIEDNIESSDRTKSCIVNIDTLSKYFKDGETVTLKELQMRIPHFDRRATCMKVLARGTLDKKLTVIADQFSLDAVKMIVLTGGKAIRKGRDN